MADTTVMSVPSERRLTGILLGSVYVIALIAATPLAYAGTLWLNASDRGWRTQAAAGGLVAGWLALTLGAVFVWQAVKAKRRPSLTLVLSSCLAAAAAYTIAFVWGGRMLI